MAETRGITVKVQAELHSRVKAEQESLGMTMNQYVEKVLKEHFQSMEGKEEKSMGATRTLAFQIPEDLFQRIKDYLCRTRKTQKEFVIGLIEDELERFEMSEKEQSQESGAEEGKMEEQQDTDGPDENTAENQRGGEEWTDEKETEADAPCDDEEVDEDEDMEIVPVM